MSEQKKPETVEEMTKRIREEEKAKIDADKPRDVTPTFDVGGSKPKKGGMGGLQLYASIAIIALIICFITNAVMGVSAGKFNADISSLNNQISVINTSIKSLQTDVGTVTNNQVTDEKNIQTLTTSTAGQIQTLTTQLTTLQSSLSSLSGYATTAQFTTLSSTLTSLQNTVNTLNASIQNAPTSASVTALQTSLTNLQAELKVDEAELTTQQTEIVALQTTTTTTPTTTTTASQTGVYVSASPTQLTLTGSGTSKVFTNTFNLTVYNTTTKTISGGVIGFTLTLQVGLPSGETVATDLPITALTINPNQLVLRSGVTFSGNQATFTGDYSGYLTSGSSQTLTITVSFSSFYSGTTMGMAVTSPTITGYTTY